MENGGSKHEHNMEAPRVEKSGRLGIDGGVTLPAESRALTWPPHACKALVKMPPSILMIATGEPCVLIRVTL